MLSKLICGRSCHFLLHSFIPMFYLLFFLPGAWWCCYLHSSSRLWGPCSFHANHLTGVLCHLLNFFSSYQVFLLVFNSSGGRVLLISSSIIPSSQVHVNSFHFLLECCPNYITLIPSLSCFNRSVVVIDLYRSLYISFQPECLHVLLVHRNHFCLSFTLQGSCNVPCSSCWTECFKFCSPPSCHFFKLCDLSRFFGFTRLSKKQFVLPLPFPLFSLVPS